MEHLSLLDAQHQINLLDGYGELIALRSELRLTISQFRRNPSELALLSEGNSEREQAVNFWPACIGKLHSATHDLCLIERCAIVLHLLRTGQQENENGKSSETHDSRFYLLLQRYPHPRLSFSVGKVWPGRSSAAFVEFMSQGANPNEESIHMKELNT